MATPPRLPRQLEALTELGVALGALKVNGVVIDHRGRTHLRDAPCAVRLRRSRFHEAPHVPDQATLADVADWTWCRPCAARVMLRELVRYDLGPLSIDLAVRRELEAEAPPGPLGLETRRQRLATLDDRLASMVVERPLGSVRAFTVRRVRRELDALRIATRTPAQRDALTLLCRDGAEALPGEALVALRGACDLKRFSNLTLLEGARADFDEHAALPGPDRSTATLYDALVQAFWPPVATPHGRTVLRCPLEVALWFEAFHVPSEAAEIAALPEDADDVLIETALGLWTPDSEDELAALAAAVEVTRSIRSTSSEW